MARIGRVEEDLAHVEFLTSHVVPTIKRVSVHVYYRLVYNNEYINKYSK